MKAWHFTSDKLRDGRPIPQPGEKLTHDGELILCQWGLHASVDILDALKYAPGYICHRVEIGGTIIKDDDKLVASERTILWSVNAEQTLRKFARMCALDVTHLWNPPGVVMQYLKTGNENARAAAGAARAASESVWAARAAAGAARAAAEAADAAKAASEAAWAASEAAWAARAAAGAAVWAARAAAGAAAGAAARDAARKKQSARLARMMHQERKRQ